jgi:hypothetical protein
MVRALDAFFPLDRDELNAAWSEGRSTTIEQAVEDAREPDLGAVPQALRFR